MQRPYAVDQFEHTIDELLALSIAQAAQGCAATQMSVVVGITSWTLQRTFTGNFDGERGPFSLENFAPRMNHFGSFHDKSLSQAGLKLWRAPIRLQKRESPRPSGTVSWTNRGPSGAPLCSCGQPVSYDWKD